MTRFRHVPVVLVALLAGLGLMSSEVFANPETPDSPGRETASSGPRAKPPVEPGKVDARPEKPLGPTAFVPVDESTRTPVGEGKADASVGFYSPINFCYGNLTYAPVYNTGSSAKSFQIAFYNQGQSRIFSGSILPGGTAYVPFYGVFDTHYSYLYVWDGSAYAYDEYRVGNNTCAVGVTAACSMSSSGWVQEIISNTGTSFVTVRTQRQQPTPQASHYDYPVAGGLSVTRMVYVGTGAPYAITADATGAHPSPSYFAGMC